MKKVWIFSDTSNEGQEVLTFGSLEVAIESIKLLGEEHNDVTFEKLSDVQYYITATRKNGIHWTDHFYLYESTVYDSADEFKENFISMLKGLAG